ncbi:MAG: hypothetical protein EOO48_10360 [Flavobacterium sp.]|nr:MAG: hypothetical protein EOO48_10360 [Flavobacterium sp.]
MKKIALLLLLLTMPAFSQPKLYAVAQSSFPFTADAYVGSDGFGFHYFINNNVFIKTDGIKSLEYSKNSLGKLSRVDIENPLLIVLFYENFNTVVLLDNQLNEVKQIEFSKLGSTAGSPSQQNQIVAHAVGMASQNRLWVYDSLTQQIGLYDYLKNSWIAVTTPLKESFNFYQTDFNNFQWTDAQSLWYATDIFGKIQTLGKTPEFDRIRFASGTAFFYLKNNVLNLQDLKANTVQTISGVDKSVKNFYYKDQILAIFTGSAITNYKITLP